ncbi:MAG: hypothetical protein AAF530_25820 [Pseudomonadota bacterium]
MTDLDFEKVVPVDVYKASLSEDKIDFENMYQEAKVEIELRVFKIPCHGQRANALRLLATDTQSRKRSITSAALA